MSGSPRPNEMSLSIKIGEHAVDVSGPVRDVWKVLEVFQRLSGFDPQRDGEIALAMYEKQKMYAQQIYAQQQIAKIQPSPTASASIPASSLYSSLKDYIKSEKP